MCLAICATSFLFVIPVPTSSENTGFGEAKSRWKLARHGHRVALLTAGFRLPTLAQYGATANISSLRLYKLRVKVAAAMYLDDHSTTATGHRFPNTRRASLPSSSGIRCSRSRAIIWRRDCCCLKTAWNIGLSCLDATLIAISKKSMRDKGSPRTISFFFGATGCLPLTPTSATRNRYVACWSFSLHGKYHSPRRRVKSCTANELLSVFSAPIVSVAEIRHIVLCRDPRLTTRRL